MLRNKLILGSLMFVGLLAGVPNKAHAGGWTAYSYNFWNPAQGFQEYEGAVFTDFWTAYNVIKGEVAYNRYYGEDYQGFFMVYTEDYPYGGLYNSFEWDNGWRVGYIIYSPGGRWGLTPWF